MPNYLFVYHGGAHPNSPEEGEKVIAKWMSWIGGHGAAFVDPGNPVGMSKTVTTSGVSDDGGSNPAAGYGIVTAKSIDAAAEIAKGCPIHEAGGSVEVAEIMET